MKKLFILMGTLLLATTCANANIFTKFLGNNNGYYYPPNIRYTNGNYYQPNYNPGYYNPYRTNRYYNRNPRNYYYHNNQQPVILRSKVNRKSMTNSIKPVANKTSGLDSLEKQVFSRTYEYETPQLRIERLEEKFFGAVQDGSLQERYSTLKDVAKNYKAYNSNYNQGYSAENSYRPPIFTGSSGSNWKNTMFGNFRNQFIGMPTGITPAMDPAYMDYFEAERAMSGSGQEVDVQTRQGYYRSKTNRGTGMGVTILD